MRAAAGAEPRLRRRCGDARAPRSPVREGEAPYVPSSQTAWTTPSAPSAADSHPRAPVRPAGVIERAGANVAPPSVEAAARMPETPARFDTQRTSTAVPFTSDARRLLAVGARVAVDVVDADGRRERAPAVVADGARRCRCPSLPLAAHAAATRSPSAASVTCALAGPAPRARSDRSARDGSTRRARSPRRATAQLTRIPNADPRTRIAHASI